MLFFMLSTWLQASDLPRLMPKQSGVLGFMRNPNIVSAAENHEKSEEYARALESFITNRLYQNLSKRVQYRITQVDNLKCPTTAQLLGYITGWDSSNGKLWAQDEASDGTIVFERSDSLTFFKYGCQICCAPTVALGTNYAGYAAALKASYDQVFTDTEKVRPLLPPETRELISIEAQHTLEDLAKSTTQVPLSGELVVRNQESQLVTANQLLPEVYYGGVLIPAEQARLLALCHQHGQHASYSLQRMFGLYLLELNGNRDRSISERLKAAEKLPIQEKEQALKEFLSKATDTCDNLERVITMCLKEFSSRKFGEENSREQEIEMALLKAFTTGTDMNLFYNTLSTICLLNLEDRREGSSNFFSCSPIINADCYAVIIDQMASLGMPLPHDFLGLVLRLEDLFLEERSKPIQVQRSDAERYNLNDSDFCYGNTREIRKSEQLPMDHRTWKKLINAIELVASVKHEGLYEYFNQFLKANKKGLPLWNEIPSAFSSQIDSSSTHEELQKRLNILFPGATIPDPKEFYSAPALPTQSEDRSTQQRTTLVFDNAQVVLPSLWDELKKKVTQSGKEVSIMSSFPLNLTQQSSPLALKENWKKHYKALALKIHPDKNGTELSQAFHILQDVNTYITDLPDKEQW